MNNKNLQQMELELTRKLLGAVNSKEEFEWLKEEEKRLLFLLSQKSKEKKNENLPKKL